MTDPAEFERRLPAAEARIEEVAADAAAARHLAAAGDRDLADLTIKVDAHRAAINALGIEAAGRFDRMESRFDRLDGRVGGLEGKVDAGFSELRGKLDQTTAGLQMIVRLLTPDSDGD